MPSVPRPNKRGIYVELPEALADKLDAQAEAERRTRTTVIIMALERYLGLTAENPEKLHNKGQRR